MMAVKEGKLSLDEPLSTYIPEFHPKNPWNTPITARMVMSHVSGLFREPPKGHYVDTDPNVTLKDTVLSMNDTELVYEPGTTQKYSNGGIALIGYLLERLYNRSWADLVREKLLDPLNMTHSDVEWTDRVKANLARATMWYLDNRPDREPPFFHLGEAPAGTLYTNVDDLERFADMVLRKGKTAEGKEIFSEEVMNMVTSIQFPNADTQGATFKFGVGFQVIQYDDIPVVGHSGAIYGFSSRMIIAPEHGFTVVAFFAGDSLMSSVRAIPTWLIHQTAKAIKGATQFPLKTLYDIPVAQMKELEGTYIEEGPGTLTPGYGDHAYHRRIHLDQRFGALRVHYDTGVARLMIAKETMNCVPADGDHCGDHHDHQNHHHHGAHHGSHPHHHDSHHPHHFQHRLIEGPLEKTRAHLAELVTEPPKGQDLVFEVVDRVELPTLLTLSSDLKTMKWNDVTYRRVEGFEAEPAVYPEFEPLLGEYGTDICPVIIIEQYGRLYVILEWFMYSSLEKSPTDPHTWILPNDSMYPGETLKFLDFDEHGVPQRLLCTGQLWDRRLKDVAVDGVWKMHQTRPLEDIRREALAAVPPPELAIAPRKPDLVDMSTLDSTLQLDIRYATEKNFMGSPFYRLPKAFAQRPAAENILKAHNWLKQYGYGLVVFDIYRPWHVTKMFWELTPPHLRHFVADPASGSIHNRGGAIDCSLYELSTGKQVNMVSGFDEMTPRAYRDYPGGNSRSRWTRLLLRTAMQKFNFEVYEWEWWHFNFVDQTEYPVMNESFEQLAT